MLYKKLLRDWRRALDLDWDCPFVTPYLLARGYTPHGKVSMLPIHRAD